MASLVLHPALPVVVNSSFDRWNIDSANVNRQRSIVRALARARAILAEIDFHSASGDLLGTINSALTVQGRDCVTLLL